MAEYKICKYCITRRGIKGSELKEQHLATNEALYEHIENAHGIIVLREGETAEQAVARCAAKGIVADQAKCQCEDCKKGRKIARKANATDN